MSKRFGESMAKWEQEQDERDWNRRVNLAIQSNDRQEIQSLIEEGVDNGYDDAIILELEKL